MPAERHHDLRYKNAPTSPFSFLYLSCHRRFYAFHTPFGAWGSRGSSLKELADSSLWYTFGFHHRLREHGSTSLGGIHLGSGLDGGTCSLQSFESSLERAVMRS